ncbi:MAG: hypothetical protein CL855_07900 [Cryomorphaceae bacterium]|nr:hypothetical protein [Cryomorphaceae bacterium]|tara:strand:- start:102 stop:566 length:465 start_codon:yes stop_codon:yes gene_type:complete
MQDRPWDRDKDYDTLVKWWTQWEFGIVPKDMLPQDGVIVSVDDKPICAAGIYLYPKTALALMEWVVTDKDSNLRKRHKALKMCIDSIMNLAKKRGAKLVYTMTKEEALQKRYQKYHNMVLTESNVKTYIRDLDGTNSKDLTWISDDEQIETHNK